MIRGIFLTLLTFLVMVSASTNVAAQTGWSGKANDTLQSGDTFLIRRGPGEYYVVDRTDIATAVWLLSTTDDITEGSTNFFLKNSDYGDLTVTGGNTFTIDNDAVTFDKIQNLSTNNILLGRSTAGAGSVEELSAVAVRSLLNIEDGATADQSDAEIETAYNNQVAVVSQAAAEAGTSTTVFRWTPQRVSQAIAALAGSGGSAIILDLGDDDSNESTDLAEIAVTGDTNSIFTEPSPDKFSINVLSNWPTADNVADGDKGAITITSGTWSIDAGVDASLIGGGGVSTTEFDYLSTITSNVQTQLNGKEGTLTNSAGLMAALNDETGGGGTALAMFSDAPTVQPSDSATNALAFRIRSQAGRDFDILQPDGVSTNTPWIFSTNNAFRWNVDSAEKFEIDANGDSEFTGSLTIGDGAVGPGQLIWKEDSDNGSNTITLAAPAAITTDLTFTWPDSDGDNGQVLTTNGTGVWSWTTVASTEVNDLETDGAVGIADTELFVGTGAGTGNYVAMSGDATMANTGALTIATAAVSADELDEAGVEAGLEGVLDLPDLQGAVTDSQVPNDITIDTTSVITAGANIVVGNGTTSAGVITINEDTDDGTNYATISVPAITTNYGLVLPADDGDADQLLQTDGNGNLDWATIDALTPGGGTNSWELGACDTHSVDNAFCLGDSTNHVYIQRGLAIGTGAVAGCTGGAPCVGNELQSLAIGYNAIANARIATALGSTATVHVGATNGTAIGDSCDVGQAAGGAGYKSVCIGNSGVVLGNYSALLSGGTNSSHLDADYMVGVGNDIDGDAGCTNGILMGKTPSCNHTDNIIFGPITSVANEQFRFQSDYFILSGVATGSLATCDANHERGLVYDTTTDEVKYCDGSSWGAFGGSLADADYGDIVVSSSGTVMSIDSDVIVNADINSSAAIDASKIHNGTVSNTEFGYLDGVTSSIQTQIGNLGSQSGTGTGSWEFGTGDAQGDYSLAIGTESASNPAATSCIANNASSVCIGAGEAGHSGTPSTEKAVLVGNGYCHSRHAVCIGSNIDMDENSLNSFMFGDDNTMAYSDKSVLVGNNNTISGTSLSPSDFALVFGINNGVTVGSGANYTTLFGYDLVIGNDSVGNIIFGQDVTTTGDADNNVVFWDNDGTTTQLNLSTSNSFIIGERRLRYDEILAANLPTCNANYDQEGILTTDGAGDGGRSWAVCDGSAWQHIPLNIDSGGFTNIDGTPNTDHTATGGLITSTFSAGATVAAMQAVYMATDGEWALTDADADATAIGGIALALEAGTDGNAMKVLEGCGFARDDTWNWTPGQTLYLDTTAGAITATAPSGANDIVRVVGSARTADVIHFCPSGSWVKVGS